VQVAPGIAPAGAVRALRVLALGDRGVEVAEALEVGEGGGIQIRRAAEQRGELRRDRIHHLAAGLARGDALGVGGEYRDVAVPPVRKLAAQPRAKFIGELREGLGIAVQTSIPVVLRLLATRL